MEEILEVRIKFKSKEYSAGIKADFPETQRGLYELVNSEEFRWQLKLIFGRILDQVGAANDLIRGEDTMMPFDKLSKFAKKDLKKTRNIILKTGFSI